MNDAADTQHREAGLDFGGATARPSNASYRVLARKYRPANFDDLIGQDAMVRTISNAFETARIPQAWILTGVRGVGKTTTARILARALNYELADGSVGGPTVKMPVLGLHCQAIMESRHLDVIEMDAASHNGVDDVRQINDAVRYAPVNARYKVYILDEVHMLSGAAFNALLKTLEEPPPHAKFIFATTEIRKVPVTVLSRCQRFDLRRVDAGLLVQHLGAIADKEAIAVEGEALALIARNTTADWLLSPIVSFGFPMPKITFLPVFILWFGVYDLSKVTMVVCDAIFPVITATIAGARGVERHILWSARNLGAKERHLWWTIVLPAALPQILSGVEVALPIALIVAVVTEMLMGGSGLGGAMMGAWRFADSPGVFAGLLELSIVGYLLIRVMSWTRRRLLVWHPETLGELAS